MSQKAVAMAEQSGNSKHLANALGRLGYGYLFLGIPRKGDPVFERGVLVGPTRARDYQVEAAAYNGALA